MRSSHFSTLLVLSTIALVASAHVTVSPRTIRPAGGGDFVLRVPTERQVPTIAVKVEFPPTLRVSRVRSKPGWTAETVKDTAGVISAVTWSGGRIPAGEWDEFVVAGRTRDSSGVLTFKAWQTYQGGEVVPWTSEIENRPAPTVTIETVPAGLAAIPADRWMSGSALFLAFIAVTMSLRNRKLVVALALAGSATTAEAQAPSAADQIAAAVLAAPPELRDGATVLGYLADGRFGELRKGTGGMICLTDDPAEAARFHVACYHRSLEAFMARGRELAARGVTGWARDSIRNAEIVSGKIKMPAAGGLYTLTARGNCYDFAARTLCERTNPVHSVYVPFATTASTGLLDHPTDEHTPFLMSPGTARAHIMFGTHQH